MTRRKFLQVLMPVVLLCAGSARRLLAHAVPPRFLRALKPRTFPGRLRALDVAEIRQPGRWQG